MMYEYDIWALMHDNVRNLYIWMYDVYDMFDALVALWWVWWLHDINLNILMFSILNMLYDNECHIKQTGAIGTL